MKKFNNFSILRQGKLFLFALLAWLTMQPAWSQDKDYLCFTATEDNTTIQLLNSKYSSGSDNTNGTLQYGSRDSNFVPYIQELQYSKDGQTWSRFVYRYQDYYGYYCYNPQKVSLNKGEKLYLRAASANGAFCTGDIGFSTAASNNITSGHYRVSDDKIVGSNGSGTGNYWYFSINNPVECSGNIMSLLDNTCQSTTVPNYAFSGLFYGCTKLLSAPTLPATTLGDYCYFAMFCRCRSLTTAPALPATSLKNYCYAYMFAGCASLTSMDVSFTSFTPEGITDPTYNWTFSTKHLYQGTLQNGQTGWIASYDYFPSGGLFTCVSDLAKNYQIGDSYLPKGWTISSLNNDYMRFSWDTGHDGNWFEPDLKATIRFVRNSEASYEDYPTRLYPEPQLQYSKDAKTWTDVTISNASTGGIEMNMNEILYFRARTTDGNQTISYDETLYYYFNIDLRKDNAKVSGNFGGILDINGNIMSLLDQKCIRTDVPNYCFYRLFAGETKGNYTKPTDDKRYVGPLVDMFGAPQLPAVDLGQHCYEEMFKGCKNLTNAPVLPATTNDLSESLSLDCYKSMFQNCARLKYIKVGFDKWTITDNNSEKAFTTNWVSGVTSTSGTFVCPDNLPHTYVDANKYYGNSYIPTSWNNNTSTVGSTEEEYDWLCFETENTTATVQLNRSNENHKTLDGKLEYSLNDGVTWNTYTWSGTKGKIITLSRKNNTDRVHFRNTTTDNSGRCNENNALSGTTAKYYQFAFSGNVNASGNIMSLLRKDCKRYSVGDYEFFNLFNGCKTLKSAPSLPATTLGKSCYERMFQDCSILAAPPALPADNLNDACYKWMFLRCTKMTYAPELPAMVLKPSCYFQMFGNCENISSAPILRATNLVDKCYYSMFLNCKNLSFISVYFLNWDDTNTTDWVKGVSTSGDFYCPNVLAEEFGANRIPYDNDNKWRVHDNTNVYLYFEAKRNGSSIQLNKNGTPNSIALLYSTDNGATWKDYTWTSATEGYKIDLNKSGANRVFFKAGKTSDSNYTRNETFSKNPNSNYYKFVMKGSFTADGSIMSLLSQDLSLDTVPDNAFGRLFMDCTVLKSAPTLPAKTVGVSAYQYMFLRCKSFQDSPELPAENLGNSCYYGMFMQCFNLNKAPELNATKLANSCYYQMFKNDTALTVAPTLPATELKPNCYQEMFRGCKNLQYMNVAFKDWDPSNATTNWVADGDDLAQYPFHNTGVFMCPKELAENPVYGPNRIPKNDTYKWYVNVAALRFTAENGNASIKLNKNGSPTDVTLQYSLDNAITWQELVFGEEINVAKGQNIYIQAKNDATRFSTSANDYYQFVIDGTMSVTGDATTLYNTSGNITSIPDYTFYKLFSGCSGLKNIPTLTRPNFPIGKYSHAYMFENCSAITEAPDSLALTLTEGCYKGMFKGCSSIKTSPVLPATTMVNNCYEEIFYNCSSLSEITVGFTSWPDNQNYTNNWATNVSKTGIFFCPESVANKFFGTNGIPYSSSDKWDVNPTFLKFTASTAATVELDRVGKPDTVMLTYSTDLRTWLNYSWEGEQGKKINLAAGKSLYFRAKDTNATFSQSEEKFYQFKIEGEVAVAGYATYLLSKTNNSATVPTYGFYGLFKDCSTITSAPAPTASTNEWSALNAHCYESMYEGCSSITTIPCELPCKQLNVACYKNMFKGCTNLTATMASLPAPSNLTESCYEGMFEGCESITTAPDVAWTNNPGIATFKSMFKGCKALVNNLPSSLASGNVSQESCYESLFEGCESMNTKIDLPSRGLKKAVYKAMFKDCKSLTSVNLPELGFENWAIVEGESALESMFEGCESLTTPVVIRDVANWSQYPKAIMRKMFKGCTNLTTPLTLPLATIGEACFESMFEGCESLTKAPQLPQTNLAKDCYKRMFMGCTSLKRAPQLPAKTNQLQDSCYAYMFNGCTSLRYIDVAFNKWFDDPDANFDGATYMWVENVAPTGTFMCPFELDKTKVGASHIPSGWSADDNGNYLYIAKTNGGNFDVFLSKQGNPNDINYQFSLDKKTWTSFSTDIWNNNKILTGDNTIVYIKCAEGVMSKDADNYWFFSTTGNVKIGGNITSLLDPTMEQTDVPDYAFYKLFSGCPNITDISELELPATEVSAYAYAKMFEGCSMLKANATSTPELPATTLGEYCYQNLFEGWTALTKAPELPASTLEEGCYSGLFKGCTSLTTAPVLPATTLVKDCYDNIFDGCLSLNYINVAFTAWVEDATDNWVNNVADSGTLECPWDLCQDAKDSWGIANAYGGSKIPKDNAHKWIILTHTDMTFNYKTGELTISGGSPIYWSTDENLKISNCTTVGTKVETEPAVVDCNEWLNATITSMDSITYYALALIEEESGFDNIQPTVNSLTIYRHPKKIDMCICDTEEEFETAMYYANKVSSANYPVKVLIEDGEYDFGNKSFEVGEYVSVIGESLNGTILKSSSDKGVLNIKGNDAYLQDMKLVNTGSGAAFTNKGQRTTLHVAMEGYYNEGGMTKHYLPESWTRATDPTQATITAASVNGSSICLTSDAKYFLVRINEKYAFANSKDFHVVESIEGKNITVRAANSRGAFGEPVTPTLIEPNGSKYDEFSVKLNGYGFSSFCFDDDNIDQLQVIGASVYKGIYRDGAVYLTRLNEHDIVPRQTGVILAGLQNSTVSFYENNSVVLSDEERNPYSYLPDEKCIGMSGNWSTETIVNNGHNYYVLSSTYGGFRPLKKDGGTIKPHKAYFDLGNETNAATVRIIFGMWEEEEEEVVSGINYLPTAGNDSEYSYSLTGVRMKEAKGLVIQNNKVVLIK